MAEMSAAEWHRVVDVSLTSAFLFTKEIVPARGRGRRDALQRARTQGLPVRSALRRRAADDDRREQRFVVGAHSALATQEVVL